MVVVVLSSRLGCSLIWAEEEDHIIAEFTCWAAEK